MDSPLLHAETRSVPVARWRDCRSAYSGCSVVLLARCNFLSLQLPENYQVINERMLLNERPMGILH